MSRLRLNSPQNQIETSGMMGNPITKSTFDSLPKIYGRRRKHKYLMKYQFEYKRKLIDVKEVIQYPVHQCYTSDVEPSKVSCKTALKNVHLTNDPSTPSVLKRYHTEMECYEINQKLSKPKSSICNKKYCFCHKQHQEQIDQQQRKSTLIQLKREKLKKLPSLDLATPEENQTKHKVKTYSGEDQERRTKCASFGILDLLRQSVKEKMGGQSKLSTQRENVQNSSRLLKNSREIEKAEIEEAIPVTHAQRHKTEATEICPLCKSHKGKNNPEEISTSHVKSRTVGLERKRILPSSDDEDSIRHSQVKKLPIHPYFQQDNASSVSSISSASLSKYVFQNQPMKQTMFSSLSKQQKEQKEQKEKKSEIKESKGERFPMRKKNGLFVIPEDEEFVTYLKDYEPMGINFKVSNLVRKPTFQVVKSQEGVYFGEMQNKKRQGTGLMVTEKQIFEGKFEKDIKVVGYERNVDGVYKGEFLNGERQGYGSFQWHNGEVFEGQWSNGTKNGWGTWKSPKGDYYEGNWLLNRQHGHGLFKHRLSTYRGQFKNFLKCGTGEEIFSNGDRYSGEYKNGKPEGQGHYEWADGSVYDGDFIGGIREGRGKWVMENGAEYEGDFKNDFKHGKGKETYKSGQYFIGEFSEGLRSHGDLYDRNGGNVKIGNH